MPESQIIPYNSKYNLDLLYIWERSVLATHNFLIEKDFLEIKTFLQDFDFSSLDVFLLLENAKPVGFIGVAEKKIEMLFIYPNAQGKGYGTQLLQFAIHELKAFEVINNETI